jgi:hypothetical protein
MAQSATVPFAQSPLSADFQHMDASEFAQICQAYNRLWLQEGTFPQIELPAPGPFKGSGPKMYICTSWSPIGKTLLQEGAADDSAILGPLVLVPKGTTNRFLQSVMAAGNGALSKFLIQLGAPYQYPHFAELTHEYSAFSIPAGLKHDTLREIYAFSASAEKIRTCNYQEMLAEGAVSYLEDLRARHLAGGSFSTDIALTIGRGTVSAAMANLFGLPLESLNKLVDLSRFMDDTLNLRPSHQQLQEADTASAQACTLLEEAIKNEALSRKGILTQEYKRLVTDGSYARRQWAYIALMLIRVSIETQIDSVNLNCRRFASLLEEEKQALREQGSVELFTHETMRIDPPIGFITRKLSRAYTFDTPVVGKKLHLPAGSFVLLVPRLLQSHLLADNCGDYLLTFGYGRNKVCPGRMQGILTVTVCSQEIFKRFDLAYSGPPHTADNAFFRRIVTAPGKVTILA